MRTAIILLLSLYCSVAAFAAAPTITPSRESMRLHTDPERNVISVAGLSQELIAGKLPELRVIYGEVNLRLGAPLPNAEQVALPPTFGRISAGGASQAALKEQRTTWVSNQLIYDCGTGPDPRPVDLQVVVSRLSPAVVLQTSSDELDLFAGMPSAQMPSCLAAAGAQGTQRRELLAGSLPDRCRWVLLWRGRNDPALDDADMPLLIVPLRPLRQIESPANGGLLLRFAGPGAAAVLPLQGIVRPSADQTGTWAKEGLPRELADTCQWWAEHLMAFPVDVSESFSYDSTMDSARVAYAYQYLTFTDDAEPIAPLPPMLALARQQGLSRDGAPLQLSVPGVLHDMNLPTIFGPYAVVESTRELAWSISGLNRYINYQRTTGPDAPAARPFEDKLQEQVGKLISTELWAPWFYQDGLFSDELIQRQLYWANPAEHAYYLTECLDLLPPEMRSAVLHHLLQYPQPQDVAHIPQQAGQRREGYHMERSFLDMKMRYETEPRKVPPLYNLYAVQRLAGLSSGGKLDEKGWEACRRIMEQAMRGRDWATLFWFDGQGDDLRGVAAANRSFAGLIGWIRLCELAGDEAGAAFGRARLAEAAALRYAMGRYRHYLYDTGRLRIPANADWQARMPHEWAYGQLVSYNFTRPEQDVEQVTDLSAFQVCTGTYHPIGDWRVSMRPYQAPFLFMTPEMAQFLSDYLKPECARYEQVVEEFQPDWYLTWAEATLGTEHNANPPVDAYQNFLARAWILHEPPEKLRKYIDVPYLPQGDYFYLHKLAEVARAYRAAAQPATKN